MSFAQLKDQISQLPSAEQRKLIAFLVALQTKRDNSSGTMLAAKIDDNNPDNWVELDDLPKRFPGQ
jgi:hypothetical protein